MSWNEVAEVLEVRALACQVLARQPLRAADALQLAAALKVGAGASEPLPFFTFDTRLAEAAKAEGFELIE